MNRKQLIILLVLVVVIGGIGLVVYNKNSASYQSGASTGNKLLENFDVNAVVQITIKEDAKELNLVKGDKGWTVKERGNYPANFEQISDFVRKAADLKVVQKLQVGPSQLARLELAEPGKPKSGTLVQFKNSGGQAIKSLQLGVKEMRKSESPSPYGEGSYPTGRYILVDKSGPVSIVSDPLTQATTEAPSWLNKDFLKIEKVEAVSLTSTNATNSWKLWRQAENGSFKLTDVKTGEVLDTNKVSSIGNSLSYASFNDVSVDKKPGDDATELKFETFDKFTYILKVGAKTTDDQHPTTIKVSAEIPQERVAGKDEKKEDKDKLDKEFKEKKEKLEEKLKQEKALEGWVYLVPHYTFESVLKNRSELMVEKKDEKKDAPKDDKKQAKAAGSTGDQAAALMDSDNEDKPEPVSSPQ